MNTNNILTRPKLLEMVKESGMKGYRNLRKSDLAEKLGIELPKPTRKEEKKSRKARRVEVLNSDGTTIQYPSLSKAAKALGVYPMQIYAMAAIEGTVRFLD